MMRLPKMNHHAPNSVLETLFLLDKYGQDARILAGGTDLLAECKLRNIAPSELISLGQVKEMRGVRYHEGTGLIIGALTSLHEIRNNSLVLENCPSLAKAASDIGATQLQHMGTIGGNICLNTRCIYYNQSESWRKSREVCIKMGGEVCHAVPKGKKCFAVFSADTVPVLIALDAQLKLVTNGGERTIFADELYTGDGRSPIALNAGELLTEIIIPKPKDRQSCVYLKYRVREAIDFPLAGVAVRIDSDESGVCTKSKIILNAVHTTPVEVKGINDYVTGKTVCSELIDNVSEKASKAAHPVDNLVGATPEYRRKMIGILTKHAFKEAAKDAGILE